MPGWTTRLAAGRITSSPRILAVCAGAYADRSRRVRPAGACPVGSSLYDGNRAGSIKCIYHPPTTPRSARSMTGVSAQSCSLRYGPSSEDLCALIYHLCSTAQLAVYQCPPVHRQVACFLASTSEESRQRYREVPACVIACVIACVGRVRSTTRRCVTMVR